MSVNKTQYTNIDDLFQDLPHMQPITGDPYLNDQTRNNHNGPHHPNPNNNNYYYQQQSAHHHQQQQMINPNLVSGQNQFVHNTHLMHNFTNQPNYNGHLSSFKFSILNLVYIVLRLQDQSA